MADTKIEPIVHIALDETGETTADIAADAEIDAGHGVPHEVVRAWLLKLTKGEKLPPPIRESVIASG
jgi:hypothetical protein